MTETELKPCPFCGNKKVWPDQSSINNNWVFIACFNCDTCGPMRRNLNEAKKAWNTRL
jgi:Lar family restriction alleviation protein